MQNPTAKYSHTHTNNTEPKFDIVDKRDVPDRFGRSLTEKRLPAALVMDVSGSMAGNPIGDLRAAIQKFFEYVKMDPKIASRTDVCIIAFSSDTEILVDWTPASEIEFDPSVLVAGGLTQMDDAMTLAMQKIEEKVSEYRTQGIPHGSPFIFLSSDGEPTQPIDNSIAMVRSKRERANLLGEKSLKLLAALVSDSLDEGSRRKAEQTLASYTGVALSSNGEFDELFSTAFATLQAMALDDPKEIKVPVSPQMRVITLN